MVDWLYGNLMMNQRQEAITLAIQLILQGLINGISTTNHLDVDSEHAVYRFNYDKIKVSFT